MLATRHGVAVALNHDHWLPIDLDVRVSRVGMMMVMGGMMMMSAVVVVRRGRSGSETQPSEQCHRTQQRASQHDALHFLFGERPRFFLGLTEVVYCSVRANRRRTLPTHAEADVPKPDAQAKERATSAFAGASGFDFRSDKSGRLPNEAVVDLNQLVINSRTPCLPISRTSRSGGFGLERDRP